MPLTRWVSSDATQELKATDAWTLFQSIDHNEDFKINLEESKPGGGNEFLPPERGVLLVVFPFRKVCRWEKT